MIDAVLPLKGSDLDRFRNLRLTMDKFYELEGTVYTVVPEGDVNRVTREVACDERFEVLSECDVAPTLCSSRFKLSGWWKQQLIKLSILPKIKTKFYLTLDADVLIVRKLTEDDLIKEGRGIVEYMGPEYFPEWYERSCRLLRIQQRPPMTVMVTPFLFNAELMKQVLDYITGIAQGGFLDWQSYMSACFGWTEYSTYHIVGTHLELWEKYHVEVEKSLFGNCIWNLSEVEGWRAEDSFDKEFFYTVIQSNTKLTGQWVRSQIMPYLKG